MKERVLFGGTTTLRKISFRFDRYGVYLLCYENNDLKAGFSFQYPEFVQRYFNGELAARHIKPGFSIFSW